MAVRLIMIVFLMAIFFAGCLKNTSDEYSAMENIPAVTDEESLAALDAGQNPQGKTVSVEPVIGQGQVIEKPGVKDIQQALKTAGFYQGKIDGVLGPNTKKAIESFQSQNGLKVDSKVGPKTWEKLKDFL